ncbi:MAG: hypothetical protein JNK14_12850 [Chitinophagaceae bacterium]|nr:hypothetical protein [Chitinophagaceae bacterium]
MSAPASISFPLSGLISILQGEGFEISTRTILDLQKVIAHLDENHVQDTAHLKFLLSPLISRNKEEQEKFYQLFDQYEEKIKADVKEDLDTGTDKGIGIGIAKPSDPPGISNKKQKRIRNYILLATGIGLLAFLIWLLLHRKDDQVVPDGPAISISRENQSDDSVAKAAIVNVYDEPPNEIVVNKPVTFYAYLADTIGGETYGVTWQINDSVFGGTARSVEKIFSKPGDYVIKAFCGNNGKIVAQTETGIRVLCEMPPWVKIERDSAASKVVNGKAERVYRAKFINPGDAKHYSYVWTVTNDTTSTRSDQPVLNYSAHWLSSYKVGLVVKGHVNPECAAYQAADSSVFEFSEEPELTLNAEGMTPLQPKKKTNDAFWSRVLILCLLLPGVLVYRFYKEKLTGLVNKFFKPVKGIEKKVTVQLTEPYEIKFKPQEDKIARETAVSQLAETLRKRHSSDVFRLSIGKTIRQTIKKGGFPVFEFTPRTQPADFLLFVDTEYPDSHLLKLYRYVISCLKKEQVNLTAYSYYREPLLLSNESLNHLLIPAEKLARLYPGTILFLFTDGTSFFRTIDMRLQEKIVEKFKGWDTKLIFTSVAKKDWGSREMQLYQAGFTVVPADVNAHQLISDEINNMIDRQKLKKTVIPDTYSSRLVNFNEWKEVKQYLHDACIQNNTVLAGETGYQLLKEWLCATAVYPKVNWEVTIAAGKAIEQTKCSPGQLVNYSNLLVLGRIQWLKDGHLTDTMRIEMLKELDPATEILAREAISHLLEEIKEDIPASSAVYGEYDLQRATNRFLVRSYREGEIGFEDSDYIAVKEYADKGRLDEPAEIYLNEPLANTPLTESGQTVPLEKYIVKKEDQRRVHAEQLHREFRQTKRSLQWKAAAGLAAMVITGIVLLTEVFNFKPLIPSVIADRVLRFSGNGSQGLEVDRLSVIMGGEQYYAEKEGTDSFRIKDLPVDSSLYSTIHITVNSGEELNFSNTFNPGFESYEVSLTGPQALLPVFIRYNDERKYLTAEAQLKSILGNYDVTATRNTDTEDTLNRIVYYDDSQAGVATAIARNIKAQLGIDVETRYVNLPGTATTLFLYFRQSPVNTCTAASLPQGLTEIWKGGSSNRLFNMNVANKVIYYSTGDKATYGTYRIREVCSDGAGVYRIITAADNQYRVFFIRNFSGSSFSLSVCQNLYATPEQARDVTDANCQWSNDMGLYYENNSSRIYLPIQPVSLQPAERRKIEKIADTIVANTRSNTQVKITTAIYENKSYLAAANERVVLEYLPDNGIAYDLRNDDWVELRQAGPFDRNYITVRLQITQQPDTKPDPPLVRPDCDRIFYSIKEALSVDPKVVCNLQLSNQNLSAIPAELSQFVNLRSLDIRNNRLTDKDSMELFTKFVFIKSIQFTPQIRPTPPQQQWKLVSKVTVNNRGIPDNNFDKLFDALFEELRRNSQARIKIVSFYPLKASSAGAQRIIKGMEEYLQKNKWGDYIYGRRVTFEVSDDVAKAEQVSSMIFFSGEQPEVSVYGLNLSANFRTTLQPDPRSFRTN